MHIVKNYILYGLDRAQCVVISSHLRSKYIVHFLINYSKILSHYVLYTFRGVSCLDCISDLQLDQQQALIKMERQSRDYLGWGLGLWKLAQSLPNHSLATPNHGSSVLLRTRLSSTGQSLMLSSFFGFSSSELRATVHQMTNQIQPNCF